jgi:uncharacterized protein (DUF2126 family)
MMDFKATIRATIDGDELVMEVKDNIHEEWEEVHRGPLDEPAAADLVVGRGEITIQNRQTHAV